VDAIREANSQLRHAQLAREAALCLYRRHVLVRSPQAIAGFTQPVHARVIMPAHTDATPPQTALALVAMSPLRAGVLHPSFARLARPLGPVRYRQGRATAKTPTVIDRINTGALLVAPLPKTPTQMVTPSRAGNGIAPPWLTPELADWLAQLPKVLWELIEILVKLVLKVLPQLTDRALRHEVHQFLTEVQEVLRAGGSPGDDIRRRLAAREGTLTPQQILSAPPAVGFVAQELQPDGTLGPLPRSTAAEDTRFRTAIAEAFTAVHATPGAGEVLRPIDVPAMAATVLTAIDPARTVGASLNQRLGILTPWHPPDPLDPVMAAPIFTQPLYKPLFDVSPEWILSGFGQLPQDIVSLGHTNERFIEAYMLGANDEMGRTLLFNEYPTDQRGSYFRQFWDVQGLQNPGPDITPIAQWPKTAALGSNSARPSIDSYLVLILRAELLRRYPNLLIYAVQAQWSPDGSRSVPAVNPVELHPNFQGSLGIGGGFWGFKLATADARGETSPPGPAGWYFALQEHTSEPRFGLEPASDSFAASPKFWQSLAWSDLASDENAFAQLGYVDLAAALPNVASVVDVKDARWHTADGARSSDLAYITYRQPVRVLVHASRMIPADA
jgi:hypothetical protein